MPSLYDVGFRIVGPLRNERKLVKASTAFKAYAEMDDRIQPRTEAYLNHFVFGPDFTDHVRKTASVRNFVGDCWSAACYIDIDGTDLADALEHAQRLVVTLTGPLGLEGSEIMLFFSGAKGFHVGVPINWPDTPIPSPEFHKQCRRFAQRLAIESGITIDLAIYDKVRCLRAPNTRHPKSGLYKRILSADGFERMSLDVILKMAQCPEPFEVPDVVCRDSALTCLWREANDPAQWLNASTPVPSLASNVGRLNRATSAFVREGAKKGERATRLFAAAVNMGEIVAKCGPEELATALLTEAALDSGLTPAETKYHISRGWERGMEANSF